MFDWILNASQLLTRTLFTLCIQIRTCFKSPRDRLFQCKLDRYPYGIFSRNMKSASAVKKQIKLFHAKDFAKTKIGHNKAQGGYLRFADQTVDSISRGCNDL